MTNSVAAQMRREGRQQKNGMIMRRIRFPRGLPVIPTLHLGPILGAVLLAMLLAFGDRRQLAMAYILSASMVGALYVAKGVFRVLKVQPPSPLPPQKRRR